MWSPWYVAGDVLDEMADEYAEYAIRRWRSRHRRKLGRSDPVRDLGKGFVYSPTLNEGDDMPPGRDEKADFYDLAVALAPVLGAALGGDPSAGS